MGAVTGQPTFFSLNKLEAILPCTGLKCTPLGRAKAPDEKKKEKKFTALIQRSSV
jgi:hypothetical protein